MIEYYDRQGKPLSDLHEWAALHQDENYLRVAYDEIGAVVVSTVWLGLDHRWGEGPPLIFEMMIFGGRHDQYQERYSTEAEALEGHERACVLAQGRIVTWVRKFKDQWTSRLRNLMSI